MKKHLTLLFLVLVMALAACNIIGEKQENFSFQAGRMKMVLDAGGQITKLLNADGSKNYLHPDSITYLIRMRFDGELITPVAVRYAPDENMLYFLF